MNPSRGNESSHISHSLYTIGNQKIRDETTTRRKSKLLYSTWSRNSTIRSRQIESGQIRSDRVRLGQVGSDIAGEVPTFQRDTSNLLVIKWKTANPKILKYSWGKWISENTAWKIFWVEYMQFNTRIRGKNNQRSSGKDLNYKQKNGNKGTPLLERQIFPEEWFLYPNLARRQIYHRHLGRSHC